MVDRSEPIRVRFIRFGPFSLDIEVFAYVLASDWAAFLETQQELLLEVMDIVERAGATIALPSQTLHLADGPKEGQTPSERRSSGQSPDHAARAREGSRPPDTNVAKVITSTRGALMVFRMFVAWLLVVPAALSAQDPAAPRATVRDVAVVTGRIDRIDPFSRSLVVRTAEGLAHNLYVGPELKIFNELRPGDSVTVRITESVVVALRPNAKTTVVEDKTAAANKGAGGAAADVLQQLKATVTVESVDAATGMITYKGADNRSVMRMVSDRRLIDGLKRGDTIEVTYTRERAIGLTKNP